MRLIGWFRRVFAGVSAYLDAQGRVDQLESDFRLLRLEWEDLYDKLMAMHRKANKRVQDGTAALVEAAPSLQDVKLQRRARLAQLRDRQRQEMEG